MTNLAVGGIDGCRAGWLLVRLALDGELSVEIASKFNGLSLRSLVMTAVDMPIGLSARENVTMLSTPMSAPTTYGFQRAEERYDIMVERGWSGFFDGSCRGAGT